jgi:hypothetical protein
MDLLKAGVMPQNVDTDKALIISHLRKEASGCGNDEDSHHASYRPKTTRILRVAILREDSEARDGDGDEDDCDVKTKEILVHSY